jgi:hypothetical protein
VILVHEHGDGFDLLNADGSTASTHGSVVEALDAGLAAPCSPMLREDGKAVGAWRWLDASSVEREADFPGGHIDEATLAELAVSLERASMPVPIDGGAVDASMAPSPVHGTAHDSGTPANGWAHRAALVTRSDGAHLYLYAELWPTVAVEVDRGRIAYGSVLFQSSELDASGAMRGAKLLGHALTNNPANRRLAPSTAVRSGSSGATIVLRGSTHTLRGSTMAKADPKKDDPKKEDPAPVAEVKKADAPVEGEPEPMDKDARIAELEAVVAELQAQLEASRAEGSALRAEAEARSASAPDPVELAARAEELAAAEAASTVDTAIREGRVLAVARERWIAVVRAGGADRFRELISGMRAVPVSRQSKAKEKGDVVRLLDKSDPTVVAMRAAGIPDNKIAARLAARAKEV